MREEKILAACLMDSGLETKQGRRARWRRAIVVALAFEAVLVAWLLLWPILTPGSPPGEIVMMPKIPYVPSELQGARAPVRQATPQRPRYAANPIFEPLRIPTHIQAMKPVPAPNVVQPAVLGEIPGVPNGLPGNSSVFAGGNSMLAPPQPKPPRMIRRSEGVQSGMLIHRVEPLYPAIARTARISGTVELRAIIGRDGNVSSIEVVSGSPLLARAAVEAVRQWRYRPTILDGEAVEVETRITVNFVLGQ